MKEGANLMNKWFDKKVFFTGVLMAVVFFAAQRAYGWIGGLLAFCLVIGILSLGFFLGIDQVRQWKQQDSEFWHDFLKEKV